MWGYTLEQYLEKLTSKIKKKNEKYIQKMKDKGQEVFTPDRIRKMNTSKALATN
jgi:RNA-directed DNA polymerase